MQSKLTDITIVGAGLSGIAAAYYVKKYLPHLSFEIIESAEDLGGTWRDHRFPGVRSDSDLYTLGFSFQPWLKDPIASGQQILNYLNETVDTHQLRDSIVFGRRVKAANWSNHDQCWTLQIQQSNTQYQAQTRFLWMCAGYFNLKYPYVPAFENMDQFRGTLVHPQHWPQDLDVTGKKVVVVGSGATAATIVPELAKTAQHVTMLQRSPSYYYSIENQNEAISQYKTGELAADKAYSLAREQSLSHEAALYQACIENPKATAAKLIDGVRAQLPEGYDVETHFTPTYMPWRQRLAKVVGGELFKQISDNQVTVVTDHIEAFTQQGLKLVSGAEIEADVIVTATGFNLQMMGGVRLSVEHEECQLVNKLTYRGVMFEGLPNCFNMLGYLRTSWSMRSELVSKYVVKLIDHTLKKGCLSVTATKRLEDQAVGVNPLIAEAEFNPSYIKRSRPFSPKQGSCAPWQYYQDYEQEREIFNNCSLDDGVLIYR